LYTINRIFTLWQLYAYMDFQLLTRSLRLFMTWFITDTTVNVASIAAMLLIAERFDGIGAWSKPQLLFMLGYATLVNGVDGQGFALKDAYPLALSHEVLHNQAQDPLYDPAQRIDHIFLGGPSPWHVSRWRVDLFQYGAKQRYPSDHFAISAALSLE